MMLEASFDDVPERSWYENKPLPRFSVKLRQPSGEPYSPDDVVLRVSVLNGRGLVEEQRVSGTGELLMGERNAPVVGGVAAWESLRVSEPSSKHYGSFTLVITAAAAPEGVEIAELHSDPLTVQVGRMWSKRRKSESELGADDPIAQIPGVGARYVARLQLHGVATIGQFAAMAATGQGRDTLCRLCKGDNPRNSLNAAKLQAMIDTARKVVVSSALEQPSSKRRAPARPESGPESADEETPTEPPTDDAEPAFSMEELLLLATDDSCDLPSPSTPRFPPLAADGAGLGLQVGADAFDGLGVDFDEIEPVVRKMHMVSVEAAADTNTTIPILPPKLAATFDPSHIAILKPKAASEAGAGADALTADGMSALELACACGHADVAAELLHWSGKTFAGSHEATECGPLLCAALSGDAECVRVLRAHGAGGELPSLVEAAERLHGGDVGLRALL